ncbi:MAG: type II toxin-antitoxin system prevent-host-death family antitoxin [Spirochaetia bacterium]|nr:type II toxin-antitoxin system prevent-host-death family antitoxin [Spirochaetia bacterium]
MKTINTHEAKTHLSRILEEVEKGEVYIISRNGVPVAELRKRSNRPRSKTDPVLSRLQINYDPLEDLDEEEWGNIE